jgi:hypothetical protein
MPNTEEKTSCYTYEVKLVVQVLAKDSVFASKKLESDGGYVTSRKVTLLKTIPLSEDK